jgi:3-hydroxyacyl-CoA dehydrogenase
MPQDVLIVTLGLLPVENVGREIREKILASIREAAADEGVKAAVLVYGGPQEVDTGALFEIDLEPTGPTLRDLVNAIEASAKPVVAALHGSVQGAALELALGCRHRWAAPGALLGMPQVKYGLSPRSGGTQRLPRLVGFDTALAVIIGGATLSAADALDVGLVDGVATGADPTHEATAFARTLYAEHGQSAATRRADKLQHQTDQSGTVTTFIYEQGRRLKGFEAPLAVGQVLQGVGHASFADGMRQEQEVFARLATGMQFQALRHLYRAERAAPDVAGMPADTPTRSISRVGILGAGTMGTGIAMSFLSTGIPVVLVEREQRALDRGAGMIRASYEASAKRGRLTSVQTKTALSLLTLSVSYDDLTECDLILEAVFEDMELKKEVFRIIDRVAKPDALLASNTSYLDLDEIAGATTRPENVVGLHFFSPANVMKLLEVVRGAGTSLPVLATVMSLAKRLGKTAVMSRVCHGFIGNRMLIPRQREAYELILEGATPWAVDRVLTEFGFPMGPFQMTDLAGLDLGWKAATSTSSTLREVMCEAGRRGQKVLQGFYDYDEKRIGTPSAAVQAIIIEFRRKTGRIPRAIDDQEILQRLLYPMINEAARILDEGIAQRASDIDVVWTNGYGWPQYTGGPLFWANAVGLRNIVSSLQQQARRSGAEPDISPLLAKKALQGAALGGDDIGRSAGP